MIDNDALKYPWAAYPANSTLVVDKKIIKKIMKHWLQRSLLRILNNSESERWICELFKGAEYKRIVAITTTKQIRAKDFVKKKSAKIKEIAKEDNVKTKHLAKVEQ